MKLEMNIILSEVCTFLYLTIININIATVKTCEVAVTEVKFSAGSSNELYLTPYLTSAGTSHLEGSLHIHKLACAKKWPTLMTFSDHFLCLSNSRDGHIDSWPVDIASL
jgi:hypothetical protein